MAIEGIAMDAERIGREDHDWMAVEKVVELLRRKRLEAVLLKRAAVDAMLRFS